MAKATWGNGFIQLSCLHHGLPLRDVRTGTQGKNLEAATGAEARKEPYWLAPHGLLSLLCYTAQDPLTRGTTHSGLGPSTSVITAYMSI